MNMYKMPDFDVVHTINAPVEKVWEVMVDTNCWLKWGPSVQAVDCPEQYIKKGTKGRIQTTLGIWVPFEITEFEDNESWSWKISGFQATGHRLERIDYNQCRLIFEVPVLAAPYALVCKLATYRIEKLVKQDSPCCTP